MLYIDRANTFRICVPVFTGNCKVKPLHCHTEQYPQDGAVQYLYTRNVTDTMAFKGAIFFSH